MKLIQTVESKGFTIGTWNEEWECVMYRTDKEGKIMYFPSMTAAINHLIPITDLTPEEIVDTFIIEDGLYARTN